MGTRTADCRKFSPNIFNKSKCTHCFRQREEHSAAALECNRASRKVSKCGYLFVAPDWDFSNPLYRTKRWQRRWFVLYDDGEFTYSVDDHPETIPQACIDMTKVLEVSTAEDVTGHLNSLAVTAPDRVTFVKGTCPEEAKWWLNILSAFPKTKGRHKRNATFPGGQATTILQNQPLQSGRSRHNSYHKDTLPSTVTSLEAISSSWSASTTSVPANENNINANNEMNNNNRLYNDQPVSSKSPPTRDKIHPEVKAQARIRSRNRGQDTIDSATLLIEDALREEKLKDIANTITNINHHSNNRWSTQSTDEKPTRDENTFPCEYSTSKIQMRPKSLQLTSSSAPSIVSAIVKKVPASGKADVMSRLNSSPKLQQQQQQQSNERGDPDGGCNMDDVSVNYLSKTSELRVKLPAEELLNSKKGWLMKQEPRTGDWSKHWFTLRGAALFYYRDPMAEERGVLDGVLDVNGLTAVCEVPVARNYGFQLTTWDNRRIVLSTVSANIRNNWLNVLRSAAGLLPCKQECKSDNDEDNINEVIIKDNTSDDLKSEIEKDFIKAQRQDSTDTTSTEQSSPTSSKTITPVTPMTPKSMLFSSDEEYRTASEGGRRDSIDSPMSPSPPIPLLLARAKDRIRSRSNSNSRLHKRSRSSPPSSRRSTIDSVGSDDLSLIYPVQEELNIDRELHLRLVEAEKELHLLKEEAQNRDTKTSELITTLERTEMSLGSQIREAEEARDTLAKQLNESRKKAEEIIARLSSELEETHCRCKELEDRLSRGIDENELLYKKIRDIEGGSVSSLTNLSRKIKRVDSLSDLTSLSDIDPYCLERDMLADEYNELKNRFEKAVNEIRAMKKELKQSQNEYDNLEITHATLRQDLERKELHDRSQVQLMGERIQDLTLKYSNSDRQVRMLKQKLSKSEKRRSLSLKGRDSMTVQKELEDKVTELESKIDALEAAKAPISEVSDTPTQKTPTFAEERALKRASARLRRKSLDSNPSEAVQVMLRLNTLEKRIEKTTSTHSVANKESNNYVNSNSSPKMSEHLIERLRSLESVVITSKDRIEQGLQQLQCLKTSKSRRSMSPIADRKDSYRFIERCLLEASKLLKDSCENCIIDDCSPTGNMILLPETNPIKLALMQLEAQLRSKLNDLLKQRRVLRDRNELSARKNLELLAERIAYESVCFGKLRDAINRAEDPTQFGEKQTRAEAAETSQLMSLLKAKLSGKCTIKSNGTIDILASVLARRLVLTANRAGQFKVPEMAPISSHIMDDLLRQQNELHLIAKRYKNNAMENLACGLAAETLSYISSNDAVQGAVQQAWIIAQEAVNTELVQSEIAHIMTRNSSRLEHSLTPSFGYTLTSQERVSFENFADAVQDALRREMDIAIAQLTQCYEESLTKMKRGQWRLHLEQERKSSEGRQLLAEFADIVAHKALVDARISVLKGEYISKDVALSKDSTFSLTALQKYENLFAELAADLQISNPDDILAEADFNFMYKHFTTEFITNKNEIREVSDILHKLEQTVVMLQSTLNPNTCISASHFEAENLHDICNKCKDLQDRVEPLIPSALNLQASCDDCEKLKSTLENISEQHHIDLNDLRKIHQSDCDVLRDQLNDQLKITRALEEEKHQVLNQLSVERDLVSHREEELNEITKKLEKQELEYNLKDDENFELVEALEEERHRMSMVTDESKKLLDQYKAQTDAYNALLQERDYVMDQLEKERDRVRKLEKRLELLQEEQSQQIECLHAAYREQQMSSMDNVNHEKDEEESFKLRYQTEIEQLRTLCEKGLVAMESSHRRIINDLEEKHRQEIQRLLCEKEQALAEETQATLAALDAMRKAHQNEVQREIARFKAEFVRQFQKGGQPSDSYKGNEEELDDVREEILSLSEKYSIKCVEAASLEEKCRLATHQLKHFQQHVQQLETRNKQLRAHLASEESDYNYCHGPSSKESTPGARLEHVDDAQTSSYFEETSKENSFSQHCKKEIHPRLNYNEGIKLASLFNRSAEHVDELTTKIFPPKITTMRLRLDKTRCSTSNGIDNTSTTTTTTTTNNNNIDNNDMLKKCSPPPLDGKDVEHNIRRFELEI